MVSTGWDQALSSGDEMGRMRVGTHTGKDKATICGRQRGTGAVSDEHGRGRGDRLRPVKRD